jgi:hypothetical protein
MKTHRLGFALRPLFLASLAALAGCSSSTESGSGGSDGPPVTGTATCSAEDLHAEPPLPSTAPAPDGAGHVTFAISKLLVGDRDRDGQQDTEQGWKQYGFDLDNTVSPACPPDPFAGLCIPREGAPVALVHTDGDDGIDNAFGKNLLPLLLALDSTFGDALDARVYAGAPLGKTPAYNGADTWPVRPESLNNPADLSSATLAATDTYVVGNTWVGRFHGELTIAFVWAKQTLHLHINNPVISMDLDAARTGATNGTIAGILDTADLVAEATETALRVDDTLCPTSPTTQSIVAAITQASDILSNGSQDPTLPCDGISVGFGFEAKRVTLGPVAPPEAPLPPVTCVTAPAGG